MLAIFAKRKLAPTSVKADLSAAGAGLAFGRLRRRLVFAKARVHDDPAFWCLERFHRRGLPFYFLHYNVPHVELYPGWLSVCCRVSVPASLAFEQDDPLALGMLSLTARGRSACKTNGQGVERGKAHEA